MPRMGWMVPAINVTTRMKNLRKNYKFYQIQKYTISYIFVFFLSSIYYSPYFLLEKEILNDQTSNNFTGI